MKELLKKAPTSKFSNYLLGSVLLLIFSQFVLLLINQPQAYWTDPQYAFMNLPFQFLLFGGAGWFLIGVLVYLLAIFILLKKLPLRYAYALTSTLILCHFYLLTLTLINYANTLNPPREITWNVILYSANVFVFVMLVLSVFGICIRRIRPKLISVLSMGIASVWVLFLVFMLLRCIFPPDSSWKVIVPEHSPGYRTKAAIAYDTQRQRAVLFGGIIEPSIGEENVDNSTWEWDGSDWQLMDTPIAPPARYAHAMGYDEARGTVIMYGGKNNEEVFSDVWEWDGKSWKKVDTNCRLTERYSSQMFYDTNSQTLMLYGGVAEKRGLNEAWAITDSCWSRNWFSSNAPGLSYSPLVYDQINQRVVAFINDRLWGKTWIWEGDVWYKADLSSEPPIGFGANMVYIPDSGDIVMFGGMDPATHNNWSENWPNSTWVFKDDAWTEMKFPVSPPPRRYAAMFYDPIRQHVIVYGGDRNGNNYDDMWELVLDGGK